MRLVSPDLTGTPGADRLVGTPRDDVIAGKGGNDVIVGKGGNDVICGGGGADRIAGGRHDDEIRGEDGADPLLSGGPGKDYVNGGGAADRLVEGRETGPDLLLGDDGIDRISAGGGNDRVFGDDGDDRLEGEGGNDRVFGDDGDDRIHGDDGVDVLKGGPDRDTISGGDQRDEIRGEEGSDPLLDGEGAPDTVLGGPGNDLIGGGAGNDLFLEGEDGNDQVFGEAGNDELGGGDGNDSLRGDAGNDFMGGEGDIDSCTGGAGTDVCDGGRPTPADPATDPDTCAADVETKRDCRVGGFPAGWQGNAGGTLIVDGTLTETWTATLTFVKDFEDTESGTASYSANLFGGGSGTMSVQVSGTDKDGCSIEGGGMIEARASLFLQLPPNGSYSGEVRPGGAIPVNRQCPGQPMPQEVFYTPLNSVDAADFTDPRNPGDINPYEPGQTTLNGSASYSYLDPGPTSGTDDDHNYGVNLNWSLAATG